MKIDWSMKLILLAIAIFLGVIAFRDIAPVSAARMNFSHLQVTAASQGFFVFDEKTGAVWFYTDIARIGVAGSFFSLGRITEPGRPLAKW